MTKFPLKELLPKYSSIKEVLFMPQLWLQGPPHCCDTLSRRTRALTQQGYDVRLLYWPQTKEKVIQYLTQTNASSSSSSQPQVDEPLQHHAVVDVDNMLHQSGLFSSNDNSASRVYISSLNPQSFSKEQTQLVICSQMDEKEFVLKEENNATILNASAVTGESEEKALEDTSPSTVELHVVDEQGGDSQNQKKLFSVYSSNGENTSSRNLDDLIGNLLGNNRLLSDETFAFGPHVIPNSQTFFKSSHCIALCNIKPVVPGHSLIVSRRKVPRFSSLTEKEVTDMWITAQQLGRMLESAHNAESLTFAIQDGSAAGQTVPHAHIHMLPRKTGDLDDNDEVYHLIDESEQHQHSHNRTELDPEDDSKMHLKSAEEMMEEANWYKKLLRS